MRLSFLKGFSFGLTSGIITTLGLIVGLDSSTHSKLVIIGGVLVIAIADAMSDALAVHVSEESENEHSLRQIWEATFSTFISKLVVASSFIVPLYFLELNTAIIVSVIWGLLLIAIFSYKMAKSMKGEAWKSIGEHLMIAVLVILLTHYVGDFVHKLA